jgi:hypothetical protein
MEVVAAAAFVSKSHFAENRAGYGENGDKRSEYGESRNGKRWKNGVETVVNGWCGMRVQGAGFRVQNFAETDT